MNVELDRLQKEREDYSIGDVNTTKQASCLKPTARLNIMKNQYFVPVFFGLTATGGVLILLAVKLLSMIGDHKGLIGL